MRVLFKIWNAGQAHRRRISLRARVCVHVPYVCFGYVLFWSGSLNMKSVHFFCQISLIQHSSVYALSCTTETLFSVCVMIPSSHHLDTFRWSERALSIVRFELQKTKPCSELGSERQRSGQRRATEKQERQEHFHRQQNGNSRRKNFNLSKVVSYCCVLGRTTLTSVCTISK